MNSPEVEKWLSAEADRVARYRDDLGRLLSTLRVNLRVDPALTTRDGETRCVAAGRYEIVVKNGDLQRPRTRFTIAHELAHVLIDSKLQMRPSTSAEYWTHESWCDRFAAQVLLPRANAQQFDPDDPFGSLEEIAARNGVSFTVAARRVAELFLDVNFVAGRVQTNSKNEVVVLVRWSVGKLLGKVPARKHLTECDAVGALLLRFHQGNDWTGAAQRAFSEQRVHLSKTGMNVMAFVRAEGGVSRASGANLAVRDKG